MNHKFPYTEEYTAIAIAFKNLVYIADNVSPRVPVGLREFKWSEYPLAEGYTVPNTLYPKKGQPNEVDFNAIIRAEKVEDYGLQDIISNDDILNAPKRINPLAFAVQTLTDLVALDRENRVAQLLFNSASYASNKQLALSGTSKFSDYTNSHPVGVIAEALDTPLIRPNTMTIGRGAWSKLSRHPEIIKSINRNLGDSGIATVQAVAELFELNAIYIGASYINSAKKGQEATLQRVWGNHISLTYLNPLATTQGGITFTLTAQYEDKKAGAKEVDAGINGSMLARSAESVKELIVAKDVGFLLKDVI
ncbi:MAG: hypothetical protein LBL65_05600 [Campylobacteraceae bacterium]|jgi:hypothetical protein|nr:hypothetical protein [Campylobacteraceae bacterium]